jgi:AcrR family transcriptional regulator
MGRSSNAKQRLILTALQLIQERSYGAVGVDLICKQAGVNKGSFYYFFPSKSDLAIAALESYWQEFEATVMKPAFAPEVLFELAPYMFDLIGAGGKKTSALDKSPAAPASGKR